MHCQGKSYRGVRQPEHRDGLPALFTIPVLKIKRGCALPQYPVGGPSGPGKRVVLIERWGRPIMEDRRGERGLIPEPPHAMRIWFRECLSSACILPSAVLRRP